MKRRRKKPYGKIALLCIVTLIATYGMGKYFETLLLKYGDYNNDLVPVITNPNENENQGEKFEVNYQGQDVFLIQNGVFSVLGGAQTQAAVLDVEGLKPIILHDSNYRIFTGVYIEKDKALNQIQEQRDLGFENLLQELSIPSISVEVSSEDDKEAVEEIFNVFSEVLAATQNYYSTSQINKVVENNAVRYEGDDQTILEIVQIIELYETWQSNQTENNKSQYFETLVKYIRNVG